MKKLPSDFMWGGSISAHQSEGSFNIGGKGLGIMDLVTIGSASKERIITKSVEEGMKYPSHKAIDFYHTYEEDIELLSELKINALRISIDWSRIYPNGDEDNPNEQGIEFYSNLVSKLISCGIEPIVTLYHFEMPVNIVRKYGSWENREVIDLFLRFAKTMFIALKGKVKYWVTFNEMNHIDPSSKTSDIFTYLISGLKYSEMNNPKQQLARIGYNMSLASVRAVENAKEIDPNYQIGCVFGFTPVYPINSEPLNNLCALKATTSELYQADAMINGEFPKYKIEEYKDLNIDIEIGNGDSESFENGKIDFIGLNYYSSSMIDHQSNNHEEALFGGAQNPLLKKSEWGWAVDPVGLRYIMNFIYQRYQIPILITENGLGAEDVLEKGNIIHDKYRIEYIKLHLMEMKNAIFKDHVECLGYLSWGPIDLVSATTGEMKKRYGYIFVDLDDNLEGSANRYKKDSFYWYKSVIESNGECI